MKPRPISNGVDKKCSTCKITKKLSEFSKSKCNVDGYSYICKSCIKEFKKTKQYNKIANKRKIERIKTDKEYHEKVKLQKRESHKRNIEQALFKRAQRRAINKSIEFSIKKEDIIIPEICPILGCSIFVGTKGNYENSPSLDRIDNSKGYTKENTQVICKKANSMKNSGTPEELIKLANWILNNLQ